MKHFFKMRWVSDVAGNILPDPVGWCSARSWRTSSSGRCCRGWWGLPEIAHKMFRRQHIHLTHIRSHLTLSVFT